MSKLLNFMSRSNSKQFFHPQRRSPVILSLLLLVWSLCLGLGLAQAAEPAQLPPTGTVDVVSDRYQFGQELYLENCATCHLGIPPAVLPTETWRDLLQDPQHYSVNLKPLVDPTRRLVWNYLQTFSRQVAPDESTPYRVADSHYFRVLHPKVEIPRKFDLSSCVSCHPGAPQFNFRSLTAQWEKAP